MLVTVEGLDGSGKTEVCKRLQHEYPDATFTRQPTHSWYGEAVRRSMNTDGADPVAELFLYVADHADHLSRVIEPALDRGDMVISDRYIDSRLAYQGATLAGVVEDPLAYIEQIHAPFTPMPELTLYLDIDPETAVRRSEQADKFERLEYLHTVQENYEQLLAETPDRFVRIDAAAPIETVVAEAADVIDNRR